MKIARTQNNIHPDSPDTPVTLKTAGDILEIRYMQRNHGAPICKVDKEHYVELSTGEVKEFTHHTSRADDLSSVKQSLRKLRDLINANITKPERVLWVTLTYASNMTDTKILYKDFEKFWKRFLSYLKKNDLPTAEYIAAAEPQGRGAWHLHCLFIFEKKAPFIPNDIMQGLWQGGRDNNSGRGFTKTKSLRGIDNPGLYFTAYLSDMELSDAIAVGNAGGLIKEVEIEDDYGNRREKAIVKGSRLHLYPPGFNILRHSRNIKKPTIIDTTEAEAQKTVGSAQLTYEKTYKMENEDGELVNIVNYRQYNRARRKSKDG